MGNGSLVKVLSSYIVRASLKLDNKIKKLSDWILVTRSYSLLVELQEAVVVVKPYNHSK